MHRIHSHGSPSLHQRCFNSPCFAGSSNRLFKCAKPAATLYSRFWPSVQRHPEHNALRNRHRSIKFAIYLTVLCKFLHKNCRWHRKSLRIRRRFSQGSECFQARDYFRLAKSRHDLLKCLESRAKIWWL